MEGSNKSLRRHSLNCHRHFLNYWQSRTSTEFYLSAEQSPICTSSLISWQKSFFLSSELKKQGKVWISSILLPQLIGSPYFPQRVQAICASPKEKKWSECVFEKTVFLLWDTDTSFLTGSLLAIPSGAKLKYALHENILLRQINNSKPTSMFPNYQLSSYSNWSDSLAEWNCLLTVIPKLDKSNLIQTLQ